MSKEPVVVSWSGGKDSALALWTTLRESHYQVQALVTTCTQGYRRISMHGVRCSLLHEQAAAIGLPLRKIFVPKDCSNHEYELRMRSAFGEFQQQGINKVIFGDLFLEDIRRYRNQLFAGIGMTALYPLWGRETRQLADNFISERFRAILVCVDSRVLPPQFAGCEFDPALLSELPKAVDPCGENGEFHTFVFDGPIFCRSIQFRPGAVVQRGDFVFAELLPRHPLNAKPASH